MTALLILAALITGAFLGAILMVMVSCGAADDAYRRGRLDERAASHHMNVHAIKRSHTR